MNREILQEAVRAYGTPFYLFDLDRARGEIRKMRQALPRRAAVCFSIKANPFLTRALGREADYVEACSFGELTICERVSVPEEKIVLSGVNKGEEDLLGALDRHGDRILYTAESLSQWEILNRYADQTGRRIRTLPRLTDGSQFGMDRGEIEEILAGRHGCHAEVIGIHFFSGTQKKKSSRYLEEMTRIDGLLGDWKDRFGFTCQRLELGCGMAVDYFSDETSEEETEDADLKALAEGLKGMAYQGPVTLEFGRRIAATCGIYVTSVADRKSREGRTFVITDGGIHQVSWYGQMMGMKVPPLYSLEGNERGGGREEVSIFGSLCTMNDVLIRSVTLPRLQIGDHLVFGRCGAYSPTEGMLTFLSRDLPQILTWSGEEGIRLIRERRPTWLLNCEGQGES